MFTFFSIINSQDFFAKTESFYIGKRAFHIQNNYNFAIVADYDGKITFIDFFTSEKYVIDGLYMPLGGVYDGDYFYIIDNLTQEIIKTEKNSIIQRKKLDARPTNIFYHKERLYITTFRPDKVFVLDRDLNIKNQHDLSVRSPEIKKTNDNIYIPLFHNVENNNVFSRLLFFMPERNTYIINYNRIPFPKDILYKDNALYILSYFSGNLYRDILGQQQLVANFGEYSTTLLDYKDYIIGNSLYGGIYFYNTNNGETTTILKDIPIKEIALSNDSKFIYAISHIDNYLYIIKDKEIHQKILMSDYPIDVISPENNIILVLSTDGEQLQIIRRFE